jgi:hypothetical protein
VDSLDSTDEPHPRLLLQGPIGACIVGDAQITPHNTICIHFCVVLFLFSNGDMYLGGQNSPNLLVLSLKGRRRGGGATMATNDEC